MRRIRDKDYQVNGGIDEILAICTWLCVLAMALRCERLNFQSQLYSRSLYDQQRMIRHTAAYQDLTVSIIEASTSIAANCELLKSTPLRTDISDEKSFPELAQML